jgi:hypothetical protein
MDQSLIYRSVLRVSVVVTAFILVFQSGFIDERTATVFTEATDSLYATVIGASASVRPTEINQITAELTKQEQLLLAREGTIAAREIELGLAQGSTGSTNQTTTYLLAAVLLIQLVLLVLNYLLDYLRSKERQGVPA